jgi:hypothetical protein
MRDHARCKERITGVEAEPFVSDLDEELTFDRVKPFILLVVEMSRRATLGVERVFEDEQTTAVARDDLKVNGANPQTPTFPKSVGTCRNV